MNPTGDTVGGEVHGPRVGDVVSQRSDGGLAGGGVLAEEANEGNHGEPEGGERAESMSRQYWKA